MSAAHTVVGVDAQLTLGTATGIGTYIDGLLDAFTDLQYPVRVLRNARVDPWRFDRRVLWDQVLLPIAGRNCALIHCTAGTMPLTGSRCIVTVHDTAWLRVQAHARAYARAYFGKIMLAEYRRAERIIVVSEFAKAEFLSFVDYSEDRIDVIYNGVDDAFITLDAIESAKPAERAYGSQSADIAASENVAYSAHAGRGGSPAAHHADDVLIVCPGTVEKRKNLGFLIRAAAEMRNSGVRIFAPGPHTPYVDECREIARACGMTDRVEMPGYISRVQLLAAYSRAAVIALPSLYEGFGYAAAQGLCAGVPVLVPPDGALAEITGAAGTIVSLDDPTAWTHALDEHCENRVEYRARAAQFRPVAAHKFSRRSAAQKTIEAYAKALR